MLYLNQFEYENIPYYTDIAHNPIDETESISSSGCGICSACMIVDHLTTNHITIEECVKLAYETGANHDPGTDMRMLAPAIAERFDLEYTFTNDRDELIEHLRSGGEVIVNVGGDREGYIGIFTHFGHFMVVLSTDGDEVCILDPSYRKDKFAEEGRVGKVREKAPFLYCTIDVLMKEAANRDPGFYMFKRKRPV